MSDVTKISLRERHPLSNWQDHVSYYTLFMRFG
jgi:hypothetical protein